MSSEQAVYQPRYQLIVAALACLVLPFLCIMLVASVGNSIPLLIFAAVFSISVLSIGLAILWYSLKHAIKKTPLLVIDETGIHYTRFFNLAIPWAEIEKVEIGRFVTLPFLGIYLRDPKSYLRNTNAVVHFICWSNIRIYRLPPFPIFRLNLGISLEQLKAIITQHGSLGEKGTT